MIGKSEYLSQFDQLQVLLMLSETIGPCQAVNIHMD